MKQPVLVVRCVSVEKLSPVLDLCRTRWPCHRLEVCTSPNRVGELATDPRIDLIRTINVGVNGIRDPLPWSQSYESVVIPVGNRYGLGYGNVLRSVRRVETKAFYLAPYCGKLLPISLFRLQTSFLIEEGLSRAFDVPGKLIGTRFVRKIGPGCAPCPTRDY